MTELYTKLSRDIFQNDDFKIASHALFEAYIRKTACDEYSIDSDVVRKLTTSVQYFYRSSDYEMRREGAELLSMLLAVAPDKAPELVGIADHIFAEAGDFPNIELLEKKFPGKKFKLCLFDEIRKDLRRSLNTVDVIGHVLTDYQRNLWEHLISGEDIITSAPTSTGKTHIILKFLIEKVANSSASFAAVVVPTRALISEVASKIYELTKEIEQENNIEVCTFPKEAVFSEKTIFVMTQERLSETLYSNLLSFDYLFVDEAHNIADKNRGVLLHMTLQKLLENSTPQIIISMPSRRYLNAFAHVFGDTEFITRSTSHSPVAKLFIEARLSARDIVLRRKGNEKSVKINKNFTSSKLANIVRRLGANESNIIYCNRTNDCERVANQIADLIPQFKDNLRLEEAADYVETFINKDFTLANNLKKGVAFHYGPLPDVVRRLVETLARENLIDFIACTSTLAEGVNLPAKNLFLKNPKQFSGIGEAYVRLEDVKLDNITGRAGRMIEHFAGNIFLVEPEQWDIKDYFESSEEADKISTYFQVINDSFDHIVGILKGILEASSGNASAEYSVANKLIREYESETILRTMQAKEISLSARHKSSLINAVKTAYENLIVSPFTLEANPTIGYLQQNRLYNFLYERKNLSEWVLTHPMSPEFYDRLIKNCTILQENGIFLPDNTIEVMCTIANKWIKGRPLHSIIADQIKRNPEKDCNSNVRKIIRTINNDIRFKMASALRCYQHLLTDVVAQRGENITSVSLHGYIEAGGWQERLIQLINLGLSRETAIEIHHLLSKGVDISSFNSLRALLRSGQLKGMHPITRKEVERLIL